MNLRGRLLAAISLVAPAVAHAGPAVDLPPDLAGVGIEQKLDAPLPLALSLVDEEGRRVTLGQYFRAGRPVLLNLAYYRCPMLCTLVLDGVGQALLPIGLQPGRDFELVTVSIDPRETPAMARARKERAIAAYAGGSPGVGAAWHFLTGEAAAVEQLAAAVGFRYRYLPERDEYAHAAATVVVTPDGRVARYLMGLTHDPRSLRLALVEAAGGRIGSIVDAFVLYCYRYDATSGKYTPLAWRVMRLGASLAALVLAATVLTWWVREARSRRAA